MQESQPVNVNRKSQGNVAGKNHGKLLLNLYTTFDFCILNSVCKGDLQRLVVAWIIILFCQMICM